MKKFLLAPLLAALAMFVLGAVYWMSPFPYKVLGRVADDRAAADTLAKIFPETGTYLVPGVYLDAKTMTELYQRGPVVLVQFVKEGHPDMEPAVLVEGYVHYFVVALLLALFLCKIQPTFVGYCCVVKATTLIGVIGAVFVCLSNPIWWHQAWGWHLVNALYTVLAFLVGGLVLGIFFKPAKPAAVPAV